MPLQPHPRVIFRSGFIPTTWPMPRRRVLYKWRVQGRVFPHPGKTRDGSKLCGLYIGQCFIFHKILGTRTKEKERFVKESTLPALLGTSTLSF